MADGRKKNGGSRANAGRKKLHDEIEARDLSIEAIKAVYGTVQGGMEALLRTEEPSLVKFVFEHAIGKPTDKVQHSGDPDQPVLFQLDKRFNLK